MTALLPLLGNKQLVKSGLVSEYRFTEGAGAVLTDYVSGYNGTLSAGTNAPDWVKEGLSFNGFQYVDCGNNILKTNNEPFTIMVAHAPAALQTKAGPICKNSSVGGSGGSGVYFSTNNTGTLSFQFFNTDGSKSRISNVSNPGYGAGEWRVHTGVFDGVISTIYKNGTRAPLNRSGFTADATNDLWIGRYGYTANTAYAGKVGYVLIYNQALTASEISQNLGFLRNVMWKRGVSIVY